MRFPFLAFPELVQSEVLLKLDPFDIIYFSFISRKAKALVKRSKKKIDLFTWRFSGLRFYIELTSERKTTDLAVLARTDKPNRLSFNHKVLFKSREDPYCIGKRSVTDAEKMEMLGELSKLIIDIFNVKGYHFDGRISNYKGFVLKYTKKLKVLSITEIDVCEIHSVIEEFGVEELSVRSAPFCWPTTQYDLPLKLEVLKCDSFDWLSEQAFWAMDCEKITLKSEFLSTDKVREVIRRWMNGEWRNLKEFTMSPRRSVRRILEGFEAEQIDKDSYRVRRVDGTTAIIATKWPGFVITVDK